MVRTMYSPGKSRGRLLQAGNDEIYLAQMLVSLPANANDSELASAKKKAEDILRDASSEKDFLSYGKRIATPGSGVRVEDLGYRTLDRLPQLFIDATQGVGSNQLVSRVLQSGAGFHIIKVIDRKGSVVTNTQNIVVTQTQARTHPSTAGNSQEKLNTHWYAAKSFTKTSSNCCFSDTIINLMGYANICIPHERN